jgi:membrane fusion protein (multidrug efflux system)
MSTTNETISQNATATQPETAPRSTDAASHPAAPTPSAPVAHHADSGHSGARKPLLRIVFAVIVLVVIVAAIRWIVDSLNTVSTDDAYVNGHVTFVAARVPGQVVKVFVDDNNRVHKGDILVQLDKEPYEVQLKIAQAAVGAAQSDLVTAQAQARGTEGQMRSLRFALDRSIEDVHNQVAILASKVATLDSRKAEVAKAQADYDRAVPLVKTGAVSKEDFDTRTEALAVAKAQADEALQGVYQVRVALGLPPQPADGGDLTEVPPNLDQNFSSVRQAQASLIQAAATLGVTESFNKTPAQMVQDFTNQDPNGNFDKIYAKLLLTAPAVKQAQAKLAQTERDLEQAELNLKYTDVVSEIDGVVTRRDVNPGNNVVAGQSLMAVRSLTEIWVDANFKETQLADLRIGQSVDIDTDIYGSKHTFKGRISGFTMGTGSTLALLPAENATGNFVKVVQRLPVRIDLVDYDPDKVPLFIGLSVTPTVHLSEAAEGADAGKVLQPYLPMNVPTTVPSGVEPTTEPALINIDTAINGSGTTNPGDVDGSTMNTPIPKFTMTPTAAADPSGAANPGSANQGGAANSGEAIHPIPAGTPAIPTTLPEPHP